MVLGLLLAFACGHVIAWVYMLTHSGLSYSRSFVNSLIIMPTIVSLVMGVLANNILTAFGMMAVFAIVRFRNILRDTLDTTYVLIVLVIGMACGTQKYPGRHRLSGHGGRHALPVDDRLRQPASLRFDRQSALVPSAGRSPGTGPRPPTAQPAQPLRQSAFHEGYEGTDLSYRLLLRDTKRAEDLLTELRSTTGVSRVTSMQAEDESEV